MAIVQTKIVGKHWLDKGPAESYSRMIADGLPSGITSAGRTYAEQKKLYDDWKAGRFQTSGAVSAPGSKWSLHEKGNAIDVPEPARAWMHKHGAKYGWINPAWAKNKRGNYEPWHFEYDASKDSRKPKAKTIAQLAQEVLDGKHGSGEARRKSLGSKYEAVQAEVNRILTKKPAGKTVAQMATEVITGKHGSGHAARQKSLKIDSATYAKVRAEVNRRLK